MFIAEQISDYRRLTIYNAREVIARSDSVRITESSIKEQLGLPYRLFGSAIRAVIAESVFKGVLELTDVIPPSTSFSPEGMVSVCSQATQIYAKKSGGQAYAS